ncbi:MAG TPA: FAD-dependent oxidoreductase [Candidatus Krumholzibacteria bacterium]|nr:FAD-dependent oxidoreductase [Candidatus Krumholzibacteria bacterium]HPD73192.1 FAD-dependent oxidoreductase [Candidatus Krumholzibacteria bacterium]HRY41930.1 FAD-dependent oxidoreductase [Candidatus Krumholzibacteria bacterium]
MTVELAPLSLAGLLEWIRRERATRGTVFGLCEDLFCTDLRGRPDALWRRGHRLDAPIGVAAGPHTQLAPNLVAAWLCGARYLELKTVQARDRLAIARPCIDMQDAGYNCEWSQELSLDASAGQYLDAWTAIRVLQLEVGALDPDEPGFVMDVSVGYDLAGITSARVQRCLDRLTASRAELDQRLRAAAAVAPAALAIPVPDRLADSVTVSTMHGCPPEEIERIGRFLLDERGLHTTIKLNPTLLGRGEVRDLINGTLGFAVDIPDETFAQDLAWDAAVDLVRSLQGTAARAGRQFAVKLTNTLACRNTRGVFPATEPLMYLSGRALHPLAVRTAARLQEIFDGDLDISLAGGIDARNVARVVACGLAPVTVCSDLLRPGGYQRLRQYLDELASACAEAGAGSLETFAQRRAGRLDLSPAAAALANLRAYADAVSSEAAYLESTHAGRTIKTGRRLDPFDCIQAPCVVTCPAHQDVPEYLFQTAHGDLASALAVVLRDNPFPTVTGMVCDHPCVERCTRVNYDAPLRIRDVKRTLAHTARELPAALPPAAAPTGRRVAVVGAGPAGLACAWELARAGVQVAVLEAKGFSGGMITDAIPAFRLAAADYQRDLARIAALGVEIRTGETVDRARLGALRRDHDAVFLAIGAQRDHALDVAGEDCPGVWPALRFLAAVRHGRAPAVGRDVVVIGGGNTAMDAARTAARLVDPGGRVIVVYRRTAAEMPAAREEVRAIREEGVTLRELLAPLRIETRGDGRLAVVCGVRRLGAPDASGRPRSEPVPGEVETIVCNTVVPAIGQRLAGDLLSDAELPRDARELQIAPGLFVGGDARRGAATLIDAIGDGRRAAREMLALFGLVPAPPPPPAERDLDDAAWQDRAARLVPPVLPDVRTGVAADDFSLVIGELTAAQASAEAARCLDCSVRCDVCVSVCPNRANLAFSVAPRRWPLVRVERTDDGHRRVADGVFEVVQTRQTANLVDFCNACGNCETFCPTAGAPHRDKPRVAVSPAVYAREDGVCRLEQRGDELMIRRRDHGRETTLSRAGGRFVYVTPDGRVELDAATFAVLAVAFADGASGPIELHAAAALAVLLDGLADHPLVAERPEAT